jgi:hypothetical protein
MEMHWWWFIVFSAHDLLHARISLKTTRVNPIEPHLINLSSHATRAPVISLERFSLLQIPPNSISVTIASGGFAINLIWD